MNLSTVPELCTPRSFSRKVTRRFTCWAACHRHLTCRCGNQTRMGFRDDGADQDGAGPNIHCSPGQPTGGGAHLKDDNERRAPRRHLSTCQGATLLGYFWDLERNSLSTGKNRKINLYPARLGLRPSWDEMAEAEDLLPLHYKKPLTQLQALAMAHLYFDPIQSAPFLSSVLKFMYRHLIISTSLAEEKEGNTCNFD